MVIGKTITALYTNEPWPTSRTRRELALRSHNVVIYGAHHSAGDAALLRTNLCSYFSRLTPEETQSAPVVVVFEAGHPPRERIFVPDTLEKLDSLEGGHVEVLAEIKREVDQTNQDEAVARGQQQSDLTACFPPTDFGEEGHRILQGYRERGYRIEVEAEQLTLAGLFFGGLSDIYKLAAAIEFSRGNPEEAIKQSRQVIFWQRADLTIRKRQLWHRDVPRIESSYQRRVEQGEILGFRLLHIRGLAHAIAEADMLTAAGAEIHYSLEDRPDLFSYFPVRDTLVALGINSFTPAEQRRMLLMCSFANYLVFAREASAGRGHDEPTMSGNNPLWCLLSELSLEDCLALSANIGRTKQSQLMQKAERQAGYLKLKLLKHSNPKIRAAAEEYFG